MEITKEVVMLIFRIESFFKISTTNSIKSMQVSSHSYKVETVTLIKL